MRKKDKEFQLLVEGKNDLHVIWNLAERLNLNETFDVVEKKLISSNHSFASYYAKKYQYLKTTWRYC